jgi:magnesium transporter
MTEISSKQAIFETIDVTLVRRFLLDHPSEAAQVIEDSEAHLVADVLSKQEVYVQLSVWQLLAPNVAAALLLTMPEPFAKDLLSELPPLCSVKVLGQYSQAKLQEVLETLDPDVRIELTALMAYPENSAGRLMDTRINHFRGDMTAEQALAFLRKKKLKTARALFLVDSQGHLSGKVHLQDLAIADASASLESLAQPVSASIQNTAPIEEVTELFDRQKLFDIPVVDFNNHLLGIIYHDSLLSASQQETSSDVLAMVGASRQERALSKSIFAVQKRMPWLQVNLLTAFMAASVVALFENTIAQFTALAVLLPVVAGQSGNAGAQALAVTMRGLALREITTRQWVKVMRKEVAAGFMNGVCIAITCGIGVYFWSGSLGLVAVICSSMVLAMVAAGFAGALVPIVLVRLGQDPAQASSIILTTVTDIAGFFAFLGIATMLSSTL